MILYGKLWSLLPDYCFIRPRYQRKLSFIYIYETLWCLLHDDCCLTSGQVNEGFLSLFKDKRLCNLSFIYIKQQTYKSRFFNIFCIHQWNICCLKMDGASLKHEKKNGHVMRPWFADVSSFTCRLGCLKKKLIPIFFWRYVLDFMILFVTWSWSTLFLFEGSFVGCL